MPEDCDQIPPDAICIIYYYGILFFSQYFILLHDAEAIRSEDIFEVWKECLKFDDSLAIYDSWVQKIDINFKKGSQVTSEDIEGMTELYEEFVIFTRKKIEKLRRARKESKLDGLTITDSQNL